MVLPHVCVLVVTVNGLPAREISDGRATGIGDRQSLVLSRSAGAAIVLIKYRARWGKRWKGQDP